MSKLRLGPVGIALNVTADDTYLKDAAELEELGYSTIWLPGGQIDRLDRITAIVRATTSVPVASGIIPVDVYEPAAVRQLYAELQAGAPDRFLVGLGGPQRPAGGAALDLGQRGHGERACQEPLGRRRRSGRADGPEPARSAPRHRGSPGAGRLVSRLIARNPGRAGEDLR